MITVSKIIPGSRGLAPVLLKRASTVSLPWDVRQRSRFEATDSSGRAFGVFLPRGTLVRGGDALVAEDGSLIRVEAAPEAVLVVRACAEHGTPSDLARAAYHLGNRHIALEVQADHLKLEPDPVLADMLRAMHMIVSEERSGFDPEGGAYGEARAARGHGSHGDGDSHGHGHGHDDHDHDHGHGHGHGDDGHGDHGHDYDHKGHDH